jgi:hypothetical protein
VYGFAMKVHPLTGEPYLAGATYAGGLAGTHGGFQPDFVASSMPSGTYDSYIARFDRQVSPNDSATPDAFTFPTLAGVGAGSVVTSRAIRVYGYTTGIPISVGNGSYSLDGGPFASSDGTLLPGQTVQVRHTAALAAGASTRTLLTVGGVSGTFDSITQSGSTVTPVVFAFPSKSPAPMGVWTTSNAISVQGTNAPAPISVTGGEYSVDGGAFTSTPGSVYSGQSVIVAQTTAADPGVQTDTTLDIGGRTATFTTVTDPPSSVPHAFEFAAMAPPFYYANPADTDVGSMPAMIFGLIGTAPITVVGGQYRINGSPWTSAPGLVNNFDNIAAQVHTGAAGSTTSATVTVGGVSSTYTVVLDGPVQPAQIPQPFSIRPVNGVEPYQWVEAEPVVLSGYSAPSRVTFKTPAEPLGPADSQWYDPALHEFIPDTGHLPPGQALDAGFLPPGEPLRVRITALGYDSTSAILVDVGGVASQFNVTTIAQGGSSTPTAFQFQDHTGVTAGSVITTESVQLKGLGVASTAGVSGCTVSITDGPFGSGGTVLNGDTLVLKVNAPSASGQTAKCVITVGGYSETVSVSTAASGSSSSGGGSSSSGGSSSGGGGGGALNAWALLALAAVGWSRAYSGRNRFALRTLKVPSP